MVLEGLLIRRIILLCLKVIGNVKRCLILQLPSLPRTFFLPASLSILPVLFHQIVHIFVIFVSLANSLLIPLIGAHYCLLNSHFSFPLTRLVLVNKTCISRLAPIHSAIQGYYSRAT